MSENSNTNDLQVQQAEDTAIKEQKKKKKKKKLIIFLVILAVVIVIAIISSKPKDYDFSNPVASVTVDMILNEYDKDTANAAEKYSDKVVSITGKVSSIQDNYAVLEPYDDDNWLYVVNAYMESNDDLKSFKVGETITIIGVCDDTTLFGDIDVKKCIISDEFAVKPDYDKALKVNVDDFVNAYKENQVSADEKYKGKTVELKGVVSYISDDYIVIEPKNADLFDWDCDIQVCFEDKDDLKKASEGKQFTIVGECYGGGDIYTVKICRAIAK